MDEQHGKAEPERQHDTDRGVALAGALAEDAEQHGGQCTADERADADVQTGQQRESRSGQGQFA